MTAFGARDTTLMAGLGVGRDALLRMVFKSETPLEITPMAAPSAVNHPRTPPASAPFTPVFPSPAIDYLTGAAAEKPKRSGVRGVLLKAAEQGRITQVTCKMPECYCAEELGGACYFEP